MIKLKQNLYNFFSLFTSLSTLICCALPTLFVTLGLGAVVASGLSAFPFLITMSRNKHWFFLGAFLAIGINFYYIYGQKKKVCKVSTEEPESPCETASRWNKIILWCSLGILIIGFFYSYLAFPIFKFFGFI
jgi:mercuric ion transport protein